MKWLGPLLRRLAFWRGDFPARIWPWLVPAEAPPLRAELFSAEQMARHGVSLARAHGVCGGRGADQLLPRLAENASTLVGICNLLSAAVLAKQHISPAASWLLDNFYLIEEQIQTAKRHLPEDYSRGLARLQQGPSAGYPRVYDIALEIVSHGDGRVDAEVLTQFMSAYQGVTALKLGELWAIPIMLRLAVIENLRRVGVRIAAGCVERELADRWADRMSEIAESDPKSLILILADMARSAPPMASAFVAELARRLQGRGPALALPLTWMQQRLAESGQTIAQLVQSENQQQAANQVTIGNCIGSLRLLGALDWREFVERMSVVEQIFLQDPAGVYGAMDFATRDAYRHAAERIAKHSSLSEAEVARQALALASAATRELPAEAADRRSEHLGFYLLDEGLPALEQAAGVSLPRGMLLRRWAARHALAAYLAGIALTSVVLMFCFMGLAARSGLTYAWGMWPIAAFALLVGSQLAVSLVNRVAGLLVAPRRLPKMDFSKQLPAEALCLIVVPTLLSSPAGLEALIEALEVRYLANRDACLHFALLTDFPDALQAQLDSDAGLLSTLQARIEALNRQYCAAGAQEKFFFFHRPRQWNAQQGCWMAYERKRGKLAALNALLRGATPAAAGFTQSAGEFAVLRGVRYVITLDTDTQLPRDAARLCVGAMAHPLNRPCYDPQLRRVTKGYGILQPRVAVSLSGAERSRYAQLWDGDAGIDPYTRAVSDVYQDLFAEGSFIGKGIYDVDAFERALHERLPDNHILSHDLLEGCYARAGLLSDVQLYERNPARYGEELGRRHRWMRGDWQLGAWLWRREPALRTGQGERPPNALSYLSQWKLIDNLRRSLVPLASLLLLLCGWLLLANPLCWSFAVVAVYLLPALCALFIDLLRKPDEVSLRQQALFVAQGFVRRVMQIAFELSCLVFEAMLGLDAMLRTQWRLHVSHRLLLEWQASSLATTIAETPVQAGPLTGLRRQWCAPAFALISLLCLLELKPDSLTAALPWLLLWSLSPLLVGWLGRPRVLRKPQLSAEQQHFLRQLARRTWGFFDRFVTAEEHWLPPDNFQQYQTQAIAHRTSPTNMGLALLANLSAYDFGYITAGALVERSANALRTMNVLPRHRGHFYNWYDTQSLQALPPHYVSTVDSGNLAGHLLSLGAGLRALGAASIFNPQSLAGLRDTLGILGEMALRVEDAATRRRLGAQLDAFTAVLGKADAAAMATLPTVWRDLQWLAEAAGQVLAVFHIKLAGRFDEAAFCLDQRAEPAPGGAQPVPGEHEEEAIVWARALARQCRDMQEELLYLAPWLALPGGAPHATQQLQELAARIGAPSLDTLATLDERWQAFVSAPDAAQTTPDAGLPALQQAIKLGSQRARARLQQLQTLAGNASDLADMDYEFLYDQTRHLLSIGYKLSEQSADAGFYDLLASEVRLGCYVAIAQGKLPQESWFALGRLLTRSAGEPVLMSWSGSMFEYLMPLLVMPSYPGSLLDETCAAAVARQIEYGRQRGVPWGISESGYNSIDAQRNYQYHAFGVPGLGLQRGLAGDLVIAPYASALALMVAPEAACINLQNLAADGIMGRYGFFEAIDYTSVRQPRGQSSSVVRSFMAHHQGMSLLALAYLLLDRPMQRRFSADRQLQSVLLLLQEKPPRASQFDVHDAQRLEADSIQIAEAPTRVFSTPDTPSPAVQLLSNGRYHLMLSNAGGGYSRWNDLAVTRWHEDVTRDNWGSFCYVRELGARHGAHDKFWSITHQPSLVRAEQYSAIFSEGRAEFRRRDVLDDEAFIDTHTEVVVSSEDDIELRRVRITNRSRQSRQIEVTSYAEVVLAAAAEDALHPAFSNLFVQTEILRARSAILCSRRPRAASQTPPWMLHLMVVQGAAAGNMSCETDRARFVGRGRSTANPLAMASRAPLSDSAGPVLDPIVAIRHVITLAAAQTATIDIVTGVVQTRDQALRLIDKYQDRHLADRVFELAWTHSQVVLQQLNASEAEAQLYARLAAAVIYASPALRADAATLVQNRRGQSGLWGYAISGDLPIVLLQINDAGNIELVRQLVQAHAYWRLKGLAVDLVIWNEDHAGYRLRLQEQIMGMIASGIEASVIDRPGGIFVRPAEQISNEDRVLFHAVARVLMSDQRGTLEEQLDQRSIAEIRPATLVAQRPLRIEPAQPLRPALAGNGLGAFSADAREYCIELPVGVSTPAPWVNVLANAQFGSVVSEGGAAYTWSENAHEFRLSPWHNDPVADSCGEAIYLRDEDSAQFWSPSPWPARAPAHYSVRHGFGYSVFETCVDGIHSELWVYVAQDAALKFSALKIRNQSNRPRKLSATCYVEWVLGDLREKSAMHVCTEIDARTGALYARNPYNAEFAEWLAFLDVDEPRHTCSADRTEFIGRNGTLARPAAMQRTRLSGKVGAGLDPCGAIQVYVELAAGAEREIVFRMGVGKGASETAQLVQGFRGCGAAHAALAAVRAHWQRTLGRVQIETPDASINALANGWLLYQTLGCRIWARSGFYQSGGAFGFRDQLQDAMALIHTRPDVLRQQLVLCASRQFQEGDVQHWWHPPSGRGVRTHCSDDYLWLPLALCRYVEATAEHGVLDERIAFLDGRPVNAEDESYYDLPACSAEQASLYEHCVRAIRHGLRFGEHGLPLIGSGDWNDGMNLVGAQGRGESVWLAFFLCEVLRQFAPLAKAYGDGAFAATCQLEEAQLRAKIEEHAWDGQWYRRAWFDDGSVLGSASNSECRIDSVAQSWSVLSQAPANRCADKSSRMRIAMQSVNTLLLRREDKLLQLLDPPFDHAEPSPGYIRGYVPGVRENGGQYTHAAIWSAMAYAALGDAEHAHEVLNMVNPARHAQSPAGAARYKLEPYAIAGDIYACAPHTGRGGWSWYTGSAGWTYRLILESILGIKRVGNSLQITPCLPVAWPSCSLVYRYGETPYNIRLSRSDATEAGPGVLLDGVTQDGNAIMLSDDGLVHQVVLVMAVSHQEDGSQSAL
jgi:cyclic beta-1,2-glucan synthetase